MFDKLYIYNVMSIIVFSIWGECNFLFLWGQDEVKISEQG